MPRTYRLGKRADQKGATRAAIVQAAVELYTEQGISRTSMAQVAHRADVAPATVFNHFAIKEDLDDAIVTMVLDEIRLPELSAYDGLSTIRERVHRLALEMAAFMERSEGWYLIWAQDPSTNGPWGSAVSAYYVRMEEMLRGALGTLAGDEEAFAMLGAVVDPRFFAMLAEGGRSGDDVAKLVTAALTPWLEQREEGSSGRD